MSDDQGRPDSQKSRQELLDEIYLLRDVAGEREQRNLELQGELSLLLRSPWRRLTARLRLLPRWPGRLMRRGVYTAQSSAGADVTQRDAGDTRSPVSDRHEGKQHLFADITELALREGRTGVQRVTRQILRALLASPPPDYVVEPVYAPAGHPYRLARRFVAKSFGHVDPSVSEPPMDARSGDVFLGLDHAMEAVIEHAAELAALRDNGVRVWFVCNDILPLSHPEWFPPDVHTAFKAWLESIVRVADGIACISHATEDELKHWLDQTQPARQPPLRLGHFHLGSDIPTETTSTGFTPEQAASLESLRTLPSFLTVGTLEPRKGHAQALEAFELLWAQGENVAWVIVGLPGWMTEVVQRRIRHHDKFGKRLFWFMHASDALLEKLYASCMALLAPSEGEGFGLPLVEAARHGMPILCRDLPVFREVTGAFATYFSGSDAASLASATDGWLEKYRRGTTISTAGMPRLNWDESKKQLLGVVLGDRRDRSWTHAQIGT